MQMSTQMESLSTKGARASQLRQRKYLLVRRHGLPEDLIGGCLSQTHRRCGKPNCRCANGQGHPMWSLTSSYRGRRRVDRVPRDWVEELERAVLRTQEYMCAIKEVMAINAELLGQARIQHQQEKVRRRREESAQKRRSTQKVTPLDIL